jgi:integrase/recombinase XerC
MTIPGKPSPHLAVPRLAREGDTMPRSAITDYNQYLRRLGRSGTTIHTYCRTLCRLNRWLGHDLLTATEDDLTAWQDSLRGLAKSTIHGYLPAVTNFYRWARAAGRIEHDPSVALSSPRVPKRRPHPIAEDDLTRAIMEAPSRIRPWLILAAFCGLRACEIARLRREHIIIRHGRRFLRIVGKGDKERDVPISGYVWTELLAYGLPMTGWCFARHDGRPGHNDPATLSHIANTYLHSIGITESLHKLRHRFGDQLRSEGYDLDTVAELMGHESIETTRGYAGVPRKELLDAVDSIQPRHLRSIKEAS